MSDQLTSTVGIVALAAAAVALAALVLAVVLAFKLRTVRAAQTKVLGENESRDLVAHSSQIQGGFIALRDLVESTFAQIEVRVQEQARRLDGSVSHTAVVRYDAYGEMTGRQSSSMALLDDHGSGVVLSSILHREQARMYVKDIERGSSQYELSPEEKQAIASALASDQSVATAQTKAAARS